MRRGISLGLALLCCALVPSAAPAAPAPLAEGDSARYDVILVNGSVMEVTVAVGADQGCVDGFDRVSMCSAMEITFQDPWDEREPETLAAFLSHSKAEVVSTDLFYDEEPMHEFARPSLAWVGYPGSIQGDTTDGWRKMLDGVRATIVGAIEVPLRAQLGATGSTSLAGSNMTFSSTESGFVAKQSVAERYSYSYGEELPTVFPNSFEMLDGDGNVVVTAICTSRAYGAEAVDFTGWQPLDFAQRRDGARFASWTKRPAGGDAGTFFSHDDAASLDEHHPKQIANSIRFPDWYEATGLMVERPASMGSDRRDVTWTFWHGSPSSQETWDSTMKRTGSEERPLLTVDDPAARTPLPFFSSALMEHVPPRESLPDEAWRLDDAFDFAAARVPISRQGYMFGWLMTGLNGLDATPDAIQIILQCGTGESWLWPTQWIALSAVNGQVLSQAGDGVTPCVRYDDEGAAEPRPPGPLATLR